MSCPRRSRQPLQPPQASLCLHIAAVCHMQQLPQVPSFEESCVAGSCGVAHDGSRWRSATAATPPTLPLQALFHWLASVTDQCRISTSAAAMRLYLQPQQEHDAQYA